MTTTRATDTAHLLAAAPSGHGLGQSEIETNVANFGLEAYHQSLHENGGPAHAHRDALPASFYRAMVGDVELREEGAALPTMYGHFTPIGEWAHIQSDSEGEFMERSAPGAFDDSLASKRPKVLFNHGNDPSIGRKVLGAPRAVRGDASFEVPLYDTTYNRDLIPGIAGGEYGVSYQFHVGAHDVTMKPERSDYNPDGLPERTITKATVYEFGPVTFPAFAGATVGIRSMTDVFRTPTLDDEIARLVAEAPGELARRIERVLQERPPEAKRAPAPKEVAPRFRSREEWQQWLSTSTS